MNDWRQSALSQLEFSCPKSTKEIPEQRVKSVQN